MTQNDAAPKSIYHSSDAALPALFAWLVPGFGHFVLKKWGRAALIFLCIGGLACVGYALRGEAFSLRPDDAFAFLGGLAQIGCGAFYFLARFLEPAGADTARVVSEYGTRFIILAGLLNYLAVFDAWDIANKGKD